MQNVAGIVVQPVQRSRIFGRSLLCWPALAAEKNPRRNTSCFAQNEMARTFLHMVFAF